MKPLAFSFIVLLLSFNNGFAQWELRYPPLPEDNITSVTFLSETIGFFVNEAGAIYKTKDRGKNWEVVFHNRYSRFSNISFIDNQVGFAYAYFGSSFTYTTDGGETWKQDDLDVHMAISVLGFSPSEFIKTDENGVYKTNSVFGSWDKIYEVPTETIDGGDLFWEETIAIPKAIYQFSDSSISILYYNRYRANSLTKTDSLYYLLKSNDRGARWDSVWVDVEGKIASFKMADEQTAFLLTEEGEFYRTDSTNGFWQQQNIPSTEVKPHEIVVFSKQRIYLKGKQVFKTTDGGENWELIQVPQNGFNTGYVISRYNHSAIYDLQLKITDTSEMWIHGKQFQRIGGAKLYFKNKNVGWTFKGWSFSQRTAFITKDGGYSWKADTTFPEYPYEIKYISKDTGWFMGREKLYKTEDAGKNWTSLNLFNNAENLYDAHILFEKNTGLIYANVANEDSTLGSLFLSYDSGATWKSREVPLNFESISITKEKNFGVGKDKKLWISQNRGSTWEVAFNFTYQNWYAKPLVRSINNMIWLNIGSKTLAYSKDGGITWKTTSAAVDEDMALIGPFTRGNYYLYVPEAGNVLQINSDLNTYDKRDQQLPTNVGLENITYALDENNDPHIWIRGYVNNTILYRKGPLRVKVANEKVNSEIPSETILHQNYPNPFNPTTTFSFVLKSAGKVKLSVYNLVGQEVAIILDNRLSSGTHSISFNAAHLASGTYLYKLKTELGVFSKKLTLIK